MLPHEPVVSSLRCAWGIWMAASGSSPSVRGSGQGRMRRNHLNLGIAMLLHRQFSPRRINNHLNSIPMRNARILV